MTASQLRILSFSTLYPNLASPNHGIFVENRLQDYVKRFDVDMRVVAPVPWFPFKHDRFGKYAAFANAPLTEDRNDIEVRHPRYTIPPKIGMTYAATALEHCLMRAANSYLNEGWTFDVIDAHYLYPDGVAAARVAKKLKKPLILTARGSDVTELTNFPKQKAMILEAIRSAEKVICVADALRQNLIELGAQPEKLTVLRNGVDLEKFAPKDQRECRNTFGIETFTIASVGHLIERKGHDLVINALPELKDVTLMIAGDGPERAKLEAQAEKLGVRDRVHFLGSLPHEHLADLYNAVDVLTLASTREGWPNVLLEAMACGTPVIASDVGGSKEVIGSKSGGIVVKERSPSAFADAVKTLQQTPPNRNTIRSYAENYSWEETSTSLNNIFSECRNKTAKIKSTIIEPEPSLSDTDPRLLVTVDTEELFDWSKFNRNAYVVAPPSDIQQFQSRCETLNIKPLYFLTSPLIKDKETSAYFRSLHQEGRADLGLHLHSWVTQPVQEAAHIENSWQCNLSPELHAAKLKNLAAVFEDAFGFKAITHRAGRYGIDLSCYGALADLGIEYDFSPCPGFNFSPTGGPNFTGMSARSFVVNVPHKNPVTVLPVSGGRGFRGLNRFEQTFAPAGFLKQAPPESPLWTPLRLTSEGASLSGAKAFSQDLCRQGVSFQTFNIHSSSMTVGGSPYAKDSTMVAEHLDFLEHFAGYFRETLGGDIVDVETLTRILTR